MSVQAVLREAAAWRLLGRLFECPSDAWRAEVETLARELDDADLRAAVAAVDDAATEGQYHSVFGPGGPAPPREASYHDTLELGTLMSGLAAYYDAFAYTPRVEETPDHVAVETGFIGYLKLKEAYALAADDVDRAERCARAAKQFTADHLAMMAVPLAAALAGSHLEYLAKTSSALASRVGARPKSTRLPVIQPLPDDEEGGEFQCAVP